MDVSLYARVLWRFRILVIAGFLLATALSFLSTTKISFRDGSPVLTPRGEEIWISSSRVLVTQAGFPQGRLEIGDAEDAQPGNGNTRPFADPGRFAELAVFYARLAETEPVRRLMFPSAAVVDGTVEVAALQDPQVGALPIMQVTATGVSRAVAVGLARLQTSALIAYVGREQIANRISPENRVVLKVIDRAGAPSNLANESNTWILQGPSLMKPALVFMSIFGLIVVMAFVLENTRPRAQTVAAEAQAKPLAGASKRSA